MNRPPRLAIGVVGVAAIAAVAADLVTTYVALTTTPVRYAEATPTVVALLARFGLLGALAVSATLRLASFGLAAIAARRYPRVAWACIAIVAGAVCYTAAIAVSNLEELAA